MTAQYTALANVTLGSNANLIEFSNISTAFRDLVIVASVTANTGSAQFIYINLNSDYSGLYNDLYMAGSGSSASTQAVSNAGGFTIQEFDTNRQNFIMNIMDYSATDKHKSVLMRTNNPALTVRAAAHRYASTTAVTNVRFQTSANNFATGSTFALYGVK
jgi:hypothetical protein